MDVSIIVIHYDTPDLTSNCIKSIYQHTTGITYELIVVDNHSTFHDSNDIKEDFPEIILLKSETNLGFARGNNLGIRIATGKYILLLNSDTLLLENSIFKLFRYLETKPKVGVVSPRLIFPDGSSQSAAQRFPSIKYSLIELLRLQKFMTEKKGGKLLLGAFFNNLETVKADWVWGTCFMFPSGILDKLPENKLDDTYFMYGEDMQWCMDIGKLGYEIHFFAETEIIHLMGGSSGKKNTMMEENGRLFLEKNYKKWEIKWIQKLQYYLKH